MKQALILLMLAATGCTKDVDAPLEATMQPQCEAVTWLVDTYDVNWRYLRTDTSIHWHKVCGAELEDQRKHVGKTYLVCVGETLLTRVVLHKDVCK